MLWKTLRRYSVLSALGLGVTVGAATAAQAVPMTVPYAGELTFANGDPFVGTVDVTASLMNAASGGAAMWGPHTFSSVDVQGGILHIVLGSGGSPAVDSSALESGPRWLQIQINGAPLSPRYPLHSVAYAMAAGNAENLGGSPAAAYLQQGDVDISGSLSVGGVPVVGNDGSWVGTDPTGSVDGLTGGTVMGSSVVDGTVNVTGDVIVDGETIVTSVNGSGNYPTNPRVHFGVNPIWDNGGRRYANYPTGATFDEPPILLATIDETIDDSGPSWTRVRRNQNSRHAIRTDSVADGLHWMAIEPGIHTIDGKMVQAGRHAPSGGAKVNQFIIFDTPFASPPVIFLLPDESGNDSGGSLARVIGTVQPGGFELWLDSTTDGVMWVAMEAGDYTHGRYQWKAGVFELNNSCSTLCNNLPLPGSPMDYTPGAIFTINDTNNSGSSWVRSRELRTDEVSFRVTGSTNTERMFYLVFTGYLGNRAPL